MSLAERILHGEEEAVVTFYHQYSPRIFKYCIRRVPRREDAEEIMNDVFLDALDNLHRFQNRCSLATWLYAIAHNKIVDFYRKKKIKSVLLSQSPLLELLAKEIHQPEFQYEKDRLRDRIEETLHRISKKYRTILTLHYENDISVKKISVLFNLSFKATESLLFRARQQFKRTYERT